MNSLNPKLPDVCRDYLATTSYWEAITEYTSDAYLTINRYLRDGGWLEARDRVTHKALAAAFAELEPFDGLIKVFRAFTLPREEIGLVVQRLLNARNDGRIIQMKGYLSCTTNRHLTSTRTAPIELVILANCGLDARPASVSPLEDEFLLNHDSSFLVRKVRRPAGEGQVVVKLEQIA